MNAIASATPSVDRTPSRARLPRLAALLLACAVPGASWAQNLTATPIGSGNVTPQSMAQSLLAGSSGINIVNVQYTGANGASGTFSGGDGVVGFPTGILLTTGSVANVVGPNNAPNAGFNNGQPGDASLDTLVGTGEVPTEDASVLTITFVPTGSQAQFSYVFASEEYNEYINAGYNDVFAFFVNGTNYALIPGTQTPVSIDNVNCGTTGVDAGVNCNRFVNNPSSAPSRNTQFDGLTTVLSFTAPVTPGQQNTLKLAIADRGDSAYDSAVFLAGGSFTSAPVAPTIQLSVSPSRITASQQVTIAWNVQNSTSCTVSGGQAGSTFNVTQTPTSGTATTNVTVGANPRNDTFFVQCTGTGGTTKASTSLAVGVAPPPPARPVAVQSAGIGGAAANAKASAVSLSDGGRFVAFETAASNMVANDSNGSSDVFVRDTSNGTLRRVSVDTGGTQLNSVSGEARITRDGRFVAFTRGTGQTVGATTKAITGGQVCLSDLNGNSLACLSKTPGGAAGNGDSGKPWISGDGKVTVFESKATNLLATPDPNGAITDIFSYNKDTNTNTILSNATSGAPSTANSTGPSVSCNGKNFAFETLAQLAPGASQAGVTNIVSISTTGGGKRLVTVGTGGVASNGSSRAPKITDDGRFVYFESAASNLVAGDTNGATDIFQADQLTNTIKRMSVSATGVQANGASRNASMTCDGSYVTFESDASNLVAGDTNGTTDTFVLNTATGTMALESKTSGGGATNGPSTNGQVSPDGSVVGFDSSAGNLGATSGGSVYSGQNPFTVQNYTGVWYDPAQSGHGLFLETLPNGTLLAWWFTFDPAGAQAWFGGTGPQNGGTATVSVVRTQGARFNPNFNPADAKNTPIGTLTFTFTSCDQGRVDFALDTTFATGFMNIKRLTGPVGTNCTPGQATSLDEGAKRIMAAIDTVGPPTLYPLEGMAKALEPTVGPIAGITGVWYNPAQSGQGLFFENLGNGSVLAWWFTFGPSGGQAWFGGAGTITGPNTATLNFTKTQGGRWIPNFNPANVTSPAFGPVTLTVPDCSNASLNYNFGQGFGTGVFNLVPLTRPVGAICDD